MEALTMIALGKAGAAAALGFSALGSAIGIGRAGMASIGAWKKAYMQGKAAPFILIAFIGAPLSQTIYGMILMNVMNGLCDAAAVTAMKGEAVFVNWPAMLMAGIVGGVAMGASAAYQGMAGAAAADAMGETGQGFGNYLMTLGVVETVALFVMVFIQGVL